MLTGKIRNYIWILCCLGLSACESNPTAIRVDENSDNTQQIAQNMAIPTLAPSPADPEALLAPAPKNGTSSDSGANPAPVKPAAESAHERARREARYHTDDERNTIEIFNHAAPAVVFVTQNQTVRNWRTAREMEVPAGSGTGFIWDKSGHIVTNYHVIDGGSSLTVTLYNQKTYPARLVGGEPKKDIAVLKIDAPASELHAIQLPETGYELSVGQKTLAIGNPFGLDHTLTTGIISAIGRDQRGYGGVTIPDMIQTDASINPGNSGGPLLDSAGSLIGMNTMIYSQSGASAGIGFAVPVSTIRRIVPQIISTGKVQQIGLGISILSDAVARQNGVNGVIIRAVGEKTPAAKAGLRGLSSNAHGTYMGDIIVGIDDKTVSNYDQLYNALDSHKPGDRVNVKIRRDGNIITVPVELFVLPDEM